MAARNASSRLACQLLRSSKRFRPTPASYTSFASRRSLIRLSPRGPLQSRFLSSAHSLLESQNTAPSPPSQSQTNTSSHRKYTFAEIQSLTQSPSPHRILIDVRELNELKDSGRIPTALNLPLKTSPDFMFLDAEEFEDRFGRPRPGNEDEVIFYCRSGVRSKAAAELAKQAGFGATVSEFPGSWLEWEKNGGEAER